MLGIVGLLHDIIWVYGFALVVTKMTSHFTLEYFGLKRSSLSIGKNVQVLWSQNMTKS